MILFPKFIVVTLVLASLGLTVAGAVTLLVMLLRDRKSKSIW